MYHQIYESRLIVLGLSSHLANFREASPEARCVTQFRAASYTHADGNLPTLARAQAQGELRYSS